MIQDIGDLPWRQPGVDGHENGSQAQGTVMSFQHRRQIRYQKSDAVASAYPSLFQGTCQLIHPSVELAIGVTSISVYHGGLIGIDKGTAFQEIKRVQGLIPYMVKHYRCLLAFPMLPV